MRALTLLALCVAVSGCNSLRLGSPADEPALASDAEPPLDRQWSRDVQAAFGPAAPQVWGDRLVVSTRKGDVFLLDIETGTVEGKASFGDSVEGAMALSDDRRVLFVPVASPGRITAQSLVRGERVWRWKTPRNGGTPDVGLARAEGTVVAPLSDGTVLGLAVGDGAERWRILPDTTAVFTAAPVAHRRHVLVADDRGAVRQIDAATGAVGWTASVGAAVTHTPAVLDPALLVPTAAGDLVALALDSGRELWRVSLAAGGRIAPRVGPPAASPSLIVAGATNGRVVALEPSTGAERWRRDLDAHVNGAPLITGAFVYVGTTDQRVLALDAATGETVWEAPVRGRVKSGLAAAGGQVFVLSEPRHVIAFGPPAQ